MVPSQDGAVKHEIHGIPCPGCTARAGSDTRLLAPPVILLEDGFGYQESAWEMVLHYTVVRAHLLFPCS